MELEVRILFEMRTDIKHQSSQKNSYVIQYFSFTHEVTIFGVTPNGLNRQLAYRPQRYEPKIDADHSKFLHFFHFIVKAEIKASQDLMI